MEIKTTKELSSMSDRQMIHYSTALMDRKLELANRALEGKNLPTLEEFQESQEIREQLKLIAQYKRIIH